MVARCGCGGAAGVAAVTVAYGDCGYGHGGGGGLSTVGPTSGPGLGCGGAVPQQRRQLP